MDRKAIVHIMNKARMNSDAFSAEIDAIEEISEKHGIKNIIFYRGESIEYADLLNKLEKFWIFIQNYSNKADLKEKITEFSKEYEILFVSTPLELLVNTVNEVNLDLWIRLSDEADIFRNKYLQRDLIQKHNPDLWIKFIKGAVEDLDIKEIEEYIWYPFIIKPVDWVQSSWVAKIKNKKDYEDYMKDYEAFHIRLQARWVDNKELIIEDFIDWKLYSVDYLVSPEWDITVSKPVGVELWIDVNIDDYCNIARIWTEKIEEDFKGKRLKTFVNSTVKACWIRNTFVHHEFKINSKGELKTIELNGRIWGWRLDLIKRSYGLNLYAMICDKDVKPWKLKENNIVVNIYSSKRWMLNSFNEKVLDKIRKRKSVFSIELEESFIWKEVWFTKDWFTKLWNIKLANKDYDEILKDYKYIKNLYLDILVIDEFDENKAIKSWGLLKKIKNIIKK